MNITTLYTPPLSRNAAPAFAPAITTLQVPGHLPVAAGEVAPGKLKSARGWIQDLRLLPHVSPAGIQALGVMSLIDKADQQRIGIAPATWLVSELMVLWPSGEWLGQPIQLLADERHVIAKLLPWTPDAEATRPLWLPEQAAPRLGVAP